MWFKMHTLIYEYIYIRIYIHIYIYIWDGVAAISKPQLESLKVCHCQATPTSETHRFKKWPHLLDLNLRNSPGILLVPLIPTQAMEDFQPTMEEFFDMCSCWVWRAISWWIWFPDASFCMRDNEGYIYICGIERLYYQPGLTARL